MCSIEYNHSTLQIYRALSKIDSLYSILVNNAVPQIIYTPAQGIFWKICTFFDRGIKKGVSALLRLIITRIPSTFLGIRPVDIVIAGGKQSVE